LLVDVGDTRLAVHERGDRDGLPLLVLHGGPGLDHTEFGAHLDPLGRHGVRLLLVDQRAQGASDRDAPPETWTVPRMAADVDALAESLRLGPYAVLGHSFGAFVALRHALDHARRPVATIVSSGVPSPHWMAGVGDALRAIPDPQRRARVIASFERETTVETQEEVLALLRDQLPFHFADPDDPRIEGLLADLAGGRMAPEVLRAGPSVAVVDVEDRLAEVAVPVLVLAGRHDRLTTPEAAAFMAARIPGAELVVFERSAHMAHVEEPEAYVEAVAGFLSRARP
jgi:proline iminopeptidase